MPEITLKAKVSKDHKLTAKVPPEVPAGEFEVVVHIPESDAGREKRNRELLEFLESLAKQPGRVSRSKEDIDQQIEEERNSWE